METNNENDAAQTIPKEQAADSAARIDSIEQSEVSVVSSNSSLQLQSQESVKISAPVTPSDTSASSDSNLNGPTTPASDPNGPVIPVIDPNAPVIPASTINPGSDLLNKATAGNISNVELTNLDILAKKAPCSQACS